MKKKSKPSTKSTLNSLIGAENTCVFYCSNDEWQLVEDNSSEGYHCDPTSGACDSNEDTYITEEAIEDEEGEHGGDGRGVGDGQGNEMLASLPRMSDLPKNSALYRYSLSRKILRRVRGAWAKGHYAPLEMTLKELAKFAPRVSKIVRAMAKDRCVASFEVIVPSHKRPAIKTFAKKPVAKLKKNATRSKAVVKSANKSAANKSAVNKSAVNKSAVNKSAVKKSAVKKSTGVAAKKK